MVNTEPQFGEQINSQAAQDSGDIGSKHNQLLLSLEQSTGKHIEIWLTSPRWIEVTWNS